MHFHREDVFFKPLVILYINFNTSAKTFPVRGFVFWGIRFSLLSYMWTFRVAYYSTMQKWISSRLFPEPIVIFSHMHFSQNFVNSMNLFFCVGMSRSGFLPMIQFESLNILYLPIPSLDPILVYSLCLVHNLSTFKLLKSMQCIQSMHKLCLYCINYAYTV